MNINEILLKALFVDYVRNLVIFLMPVALFYIMILKKCYPIILEIQSIDFVCYRGETL